MGIEVRRNGLMIDGELKSFVSASVQYWRHDPALWPRLLDLIKELGFAFIEEYIAWSVHEVARGKFDFGEQSLNKDVRKFFALCSERGIKVLVRPGPHINSELTYFGFPRRVLERPECLSRSVDGDPVWIPLPPKMFPAPSYASEAFYEEVKIWYDAVGQAVKPYLYPSGPIVLLQVDNEFSGLIRNNVYDHDYHPDAIKLWHRFLAEKYSDLAELNRVYSATYAAFEHVPPARGFEGKEQKDLPYYLDWVEYREYYMQTALKRLKGMMESAGMKGVPFVHNYPFGQDFPPNNYTELEKFLDFQGPDMYPNKKQYANLKSLGRTASGLSRYPVILEFGSGFAAYAPMLSLDDQKFTTPAIFMHGIKGVNFYMIAERERWYGSPISRDGRKRPGYFEFYRDVNRTLLKSGVLQMAKYAPCLALANRDYERLEAATDLLDPLLAVNPEVLPPQLRCAENDFGFSKPVQFYYRNFHETLVKALDQRGAGLDLGNTSQGTEALKRYKLVTVASFEFMASAVQERLRDYVESGGFLVCGPRFPVQNKRRDCCTFLRERLVEKEKLAGPIPCVIYELGRGRVALIEKYFEFADKKNPPPEMAHLLDKLLQMAGAEIKFQSLTPPVETALHAGSGREILFAANPGEGAVNAQIKLPYPCRLTDLVSSETFSGSGEAEIPMPGYTVRMLEAQK